MQNREKNEGLIPSADVVRKSDAAASVGGRVSWSCGSAGMSPKESGSAEREYVQAILDCYLSLPGTASVTSRHDRKCAQALFRRGVPLDVVKSAMVVAVARRTFREGDPLPRVRALHFFLPVIDELLEEPCIPGYVEYLEQRLRTLAVNKPQPPEAPTKRSSQPT